MGLGKVLVAGAGPVGLTAALVLARAGIPVAVFERASELAEDLRASTWHPPTLDMMGELGLVDEMLADGLIARYTQHRDRQSGSIAQFDLELLRGETDHPYRLQYEQFKYTRLLSQKLKAFPHASLVFNAQVVHAEQDASNVQLKVEIGKEMQTHSGAYLLGADGTRSTVREAAGIAFDGFTYPERFYSVSTRFDFSSALPDLCDVNYVADVERVVRAAARARDLALPLSHARGGKRRSGAIG